MTDTLALRSWIDEHGLKLNAIARSMGLTPMGLSNKLNGKSEFKVSEISVFTRIYGMDHDTMDKIFFCPKVECDSTTTKKAEKQKEI